MLHDVCIWLLSDNDSQTDVILIAGLFSVDRRHLHERIPGAIRSEQEGLMNQMNYKKALEMLCRAGFSASEIDRLCRFRRKFAESEMDRAPVDRRRLEFVRWLVATGRLTDKTY